MHSWTKLALVSSAGLAAAISSGGDPQGNAQFGTLDQQPIGSTGAQYQGYCNYAARGAGLENALRGVFGQCFSDSAVVDAAVNYHKNMIQESTALIQTINQANRAECDKQNQGFPKPTGNTGWSCGGSSPCKWLALQEAETTLPAASSEQEFNHPNKAYSPRADYKYPIDTWVTVSKGSLQLFINGVKVREQGDGNFFIPAGTPNSSVRYKSPGGATLQFYGVCSKDTPCIGRELQEWKTGTTTTAQRDLVIDIGGYDYDVIFTLADTSKTTEQYSILVNGMQLDKTHGPLALGEIQKYDPANIPMIVVHDGKPGALECITHGGFWASIRIPAGTEKVTVHMDHYEAGWPYYAFAYRLDKVCQC